MKKVEKGHLKVKLSQVKRLKRLFVWDQWHLVKKKIQKEETKKNKIRLHPNIVLLTLAFKGL